MLLLILDFDNTLGDTYGPYGEGNIFRTKTLPDVKKATEIYEKYRRGPDDIVMYSKLLEEYKINDPVKFFQDAGMAQQLYPDVVSFLKNLQNNDGVKTVILTTGDEDFQRLKVEVTGVDKLVDEVFITRNRDKKEHIKALIEKYHPDQTLFVDDRITFKAQDFNSLITIYEMDRNTVKEGENVIHNLNELPLNKFLGKK